MLNEHDRVRLVREIGAWGVDVGQIGTVVSIHRCSEGQILGLTVEFQMLGLVTTGGYPAMTCVDVTPRDVEPYPSKSPPRTEGEAGPPVGG